MNATWRRLTGTRTMRSAAAEFGPPPGDRYADALAGISDLDLIRRGHLVVAAQRTRGEAVRDWVVVKRARAERMQATSAVVRDGRLRMAEVTR